MRDRPCPKCPRLGPDCPACAAAARRLAASVQGSQRLRGERLIEFAKTLCRAIQAGVFEFLFEGDYYETGVAIGLADDWLKAEEAEEAEADQAT